MKDDTISRQTAIYAINELHELPNAWLDLAVDALEELPTAQPEIIRCKDCKYYVSSGWCEGIGGGIGTSVSTDDFCSRAERRTYEQT